MILNYFNAYILYPAVEKKLNRDIQNKLKILKNESTLSLAEREKITQTRLHAVLSSAQQNVPYYTDLFKEIDFHVDDILKDIRYLQELPYLTKEIIQEHGVRLLSQKLDRDSLHVRKTGGSTGISTSIYYDQSSLDWTSAVNLYAHSFTGRKHTDTEAYLSSELFQKVNLKERWVQMVKSWAMNRKTLFTHSFTHKSLETLWKEIRQTRPFLIQGHPSTLYALAKFVSETKQFDKEAIRVFESTGESLDLRKIVEIESNLGCKVYNRYGTAEFGATAHSRENPFELEVIDSIIHHETVSLGNGLEEIVGTTLTNPAMPLIRYRSGDIGQIEVRDGKKWITHLQGRIHDLIEIGGTPYPTHYLQDAFDRIGGVAEFQIAIRTSGRRVLNIVLEDLSKQDAIVAKAKELFSGEDIPVKFVKLEDLIRIGWRDKFRYVVKEA